MAFFVRLTPTLSDERKFRFLLCYPFINFRCPEREWGPSKTFQLDYARSLLAQYNGFEVRYTKNILPFQNE